MRIEKIFLQQFRSYKNKEFNFSPAINLIVGPNASGKTNLLEAIYLLATGKSFRAQLEREMITYGEKLARVKGEIRNNEEEKLSLEVILTAGEIFGQRAAKKNYRLNGVNKRQLDFVGNLRCVYFGPEDLEIIINSPAIRRDYLDAVLEQVDREYRRVSLSYKKGLRQRNKLLEQIRDEGKTRSVLFFWDKLLIENGETITKKRQEFLNFVGEQPEHFGRLQINYNASIISPQRLAKYAEEEVAAGMTLVGPHRDDFAVVIRDTQDAMSEKDLHIYGSRGEQRTAVFCLKLAELEFVSQETGERPVLLLDDIFSELDHQRRKRLVEVIPRQQTIITTTDLHLVELEYRKKMEAIEIWNDRI